LWVETKRNEKIKMAAVRRHFFLLGLCPTISQLTNEGA
jgi:hypothetical protein